MTKNYKTKHQDLSYAARHWNPASPSSGVLPTSLKSERPSSRLKGMADALAQYGRSEYTCGQVSALNMAANMLKDEGL